MTGTINANETLNGGVEAIPTLSGTLSGNTTSSYNSLSDKPIINGTTLEGGVDRSLVEDVKVNGVSVVNEEHIAEIEFSAEDVPYDNSDSQAQSTDVQGALDEAFQRTMDIGTWFTDVVAENYNYIKHYTVGDYVFHYPSSGVIKLYRCIENTSGFWDISKWEEVKLSNEVSDEVTLREELESATKVYGTPKNLPQPIATFNDGANLPMPSLKVSIEPIQSGSGDPSPSNVRPISGWTGCNLSVVGDNWGDCADIPEPLTANKWYTVNLPYNTYTISFDAVNVERGRTGNTSLFNINGEKNILADSIYSVVDGSSYQSKGASVNGRFYFTYTGKISSIGCYWRSNTYQFLTSGSLENIMIEVGNNPTKQFKPYNGHTYNIPFTDSQGNPIEVFGGECDVVNGTSGNIEDRKKIVFDGSSDENWQKSSSGNMYYLTLNPTTFPYVKNHLTYNMANSYKFKGFTTSGYFAFLNDGEYLLYDYQSGQTAREIAVKNLSISTVEDFKASLANNPLEIVYELATPTTFESLATPVKSLSGSNNVWGDCGSIKDLKYVRNLNITINDLISRVEALEG